MIKRDLKADLELCNKAIPGLQNVFTEWDGKVVLGFGIPGEHVHQLSENEYNLITQACEGWLHMTKRAIEAKKLVRELIEALEKAIEEVNHPICGPGSVVEDLEAILAKAKEVLGDE